MGMAVYGLTLPFDGCTLYTESCEMNVQLTRSIRRATAWAPREHKEELPAARGSRARATERAGYGVRTEKRKTRRRCGETKGGRERTRLTEDGRSGPRPEGKGGHMAVSRPRMKSRDV
jgi:hypothetical protein